MTPPSFSEKDGLVDLQVPIPSEQPPSKSAYLSAISPLTRAWNRYSEWRTSFDLPNPGSAEQLQKEVKGELQNICVNWTRF
jgi:mitochondrial import receptor subunit TOM40